MHLMGPLQVPKCDSDLIQLMQVSIYRNLQVYTETCLTLHLYYSGLATPAYARRHGAGYAGQIYTIATVTRLALTTGRTGPLQLRYWNSNAATSSERSHPGTGASCGYLVFPGVWERKTSYLTTSLVPSRTT